MNKYDKMTDDELMTQINLAIGLWQIAYTECEYKHEIVSELRKIQVGRLMRKWKEKPKDD